MTDPRNRPRTPRRSGGPRRPSSNRPRFAGLSKSLALWLLIILLPLTIYQLFMPKEQASVDIKYSEFVAQLEAENVSAVTITDRQIRGTLEKPAQTTTSSGLATAPRTHPSWRR